ncbi:hypothetical protein [Haloparvum sp. AD34]
MGRAKDVDEVFCTACGARIKRAAVCCPDCGVANEWHDPSAATEQPRDSFGGEGTTGEGDPAVPDQRSPSEVQATRDANPASTDAASRTVDSTGAPAAGNRAEPPSANWWYGVAAFGAAWVVVLGAWATGVQHGALGALTLLAWVGLPASLSQDAAYVREYSAWEPAGGPWAFAALVPVFNVVVAAVYLIRRHEVLETP